MNRRYGAIELIADNCTSCNVCVKECPDWCISLTSHNEEVIEPGARRPKTVAVLDTFTIDWSSCMYCGICVDACPFDALRWLSNDSYPATAKEELLFGIDDLRWDDSPDTENTESQANDQ